MNAHTPSTAEMVRLVSRDGDRASIRFGACATVVVLNALTDPKGVTTVSQSHWIRTPGGDRSHKARQFVGVAARRALGSAIGELSARFQHGLAEGHTPEEAWFVPVGASDPIRDRAATVLPVRPKPGRRGPRLTMVPAEPPPPAGAG